MINDDGMINDTEGAKILGMGNPMGDSSEDEVVAHLLAQTTQDAGRLVGATSLLATLQGTERTAMLLATQDILIHLLINVHTLLHLTRAD